MSYRARREIHALFRKLAAREHRGIERYLRLRRSREALSEAELASTRCGLDQNHVGGAEAVLALAKAAGIGSDDRVLDLGSGMGGSARLLAEHHGCRVDGIDQSRERCREARRITELLGLAHRVRFVCTDYLSCPVPEGRYSVIWGQGAWAHVFWKGRFLARWKVALASGGRLAFEDLCLSRRPMCGWQRHAVWRVERGWRCRLDTVDGWRRAVAGSYTIVEQKELGQVLIRHFRGPPKPTPGYRLHGELVSEAAHELACANVLGYVRFLACRS